MHEMGTAWCVHQSYTYTFMSKWIIFFPKNCLRQNWTKTALDEFHCRRRDATRDEIDLIWWKKFYRKVDECIGCPNWIRICTVFRSEWMYVDLLLRQTFSQFSLLISYCVWRLHLNISKETERQRAKRVEKQRKKTLLSKHERANIYFYNFIVMVEGI